jgi:hypothetical protein
VRTTRCANWKTIRTLPDHGLRKMSLPPSKGTPILAALAAVLATAPLTAQTLTPADSALLARAAAAAIGEGLSTGTDNDGIASLPPETAFDSAVAELLADAPALRRPVADSAYALWLGTRGVRWSGDTAVVVMRLEKCEQSDDELNWWVAEDGFYFVRAGEGWRFARRQGIGNIDGHCGVMTPALRDLRDEVKRGFKTVPSSGGGTRPPGAGISCTFQPLTRTLTARLHPEAARVGARSPDLPEPAGLS